MNLLQHYMGQPPDSDYGQMRGTLQRPFQAHTGGVMPPHMQPGVNTGGGLPAMAQGFPSAQTGGGLPPMQMQVGTGGYDAPQQFQANTGGGFMPQPMGLPPHAGQLARMATGIPGRPSMDPLGMFSSASDRGLHNGQALRMGNGRLNEYRYGAERGDRAY